MKKGALNKLTHYREDGSAYYERRRNKAAPKEKDRNEEGDPENLGTINIIAGGPKS